MDATKLRDNSYVLLTPQHYNDKFLFGEGPARGFTQGPYLLKYDANKQAWCVDTVRPWSNGLPTHVWYLDPEDIMCEVGDPVAPAAPEPLDWEESYRRKRDANLRAVFGR